MSNHHNHPSHVHNFFNKHTAFAILVLIIGSFCAGYFVGTYSGFEREEGIYRSTMYRGMNYQYPKGVQYNTVR